MTPVERCPNKTASTNANEHEDANAGLDSGYVVRAVGVGNVQQIAVCIVVRTCFASACHLEL